MLLLVFCILVSKTNTMRTLLLFLFLAGFHLNVLSQTISGFSKESTAAQIALEKKFDQSLQADNFDAWMKKLSARPHHLGSPFGKETAEFIRDQFRSWGYDAEVETFHVLFPTPRIRLLEMTTPRKYKARLKEKVVKEDTHSGYVKEQLPPYNCWSADGDVTAELVYVNYGLPEDYEELARMGIDVRGKIVIARYGNSWRGIKPKVAQEHGAIGCILYSDPKEDGYFQGDVYPEGPYKNESGAQRGAVIDLPVAPGDPLTPGYGATADAERIERQTSIALLKIPVLPISYGDALPLLAAMKGPVAPPSWRGALPLTYHVGPGPARVHLQLAFNWDIVPCYNVIARLKGAVYPDEWVIRGNHHDAWVYGASDPISGLAALMEEARAVSELVKGGWKPKRTIIYCAWDGEEPGLIGSTEWVEMHADALRKHAVAYINTDGNSRGFLYAGGSHTLETFMSEVARDVTDPQTGVSVLERALSRDAVNARHTDARKEVLHRKKLKLGALGSGSDYSPFIQHVGIPSLNLAYGGEGSGGEYHSMYDSYDHYRRFKDPEFAYGVTLTKTAGRATLRLADAGRLPFDFKALYQTAETYLEEVMNLLDDIREETKIENQMIEDHRFAYAADPVKNTVLPEAKPPVPYLDFSPLRNALARLAATVQTLSPSETTGAPTDIEAVNALFYRAEQQLLVDTGLPRRPWYRHTLYAPGYYTGYGVKTLPGIREAIEQRNWQEAREQISVVEQALVRYTDTLEEAAKYMKP